MLADILGEQTLRLLEAFEIQARRNFLGNRQGAHRSPKRGHGIEFSDYRVYQPGDDPRHIDWGLFGRSDRVYIKRFQEEQDLNIYIILDASPSMFLEDSDRWQRMYKLSLALAYISLMQQDSVRLVLPGTISNYQIAGLAGLQKVSDELVNYKVIKNFDWVLELRKFVSGFRFPGVCFLLSDFLFPLEQSTRILYDLLAKNLEINIVRICSDQDKNPFSDLGNYEVQDVETGELIKVPWGSKAREEYQVRLQKHFNDLRLFCKQRQIFFSEYKESDEIAQFLANSLQLNGIMKC